MGLRMASSLMVGAVVLMAMVAVALHGAEEGEFKGVVPMVRAAEAERSAKSSKDPTTQYMIVSGVNGRTRAVCYAKGRCFLAKLTCPIECPLRKTSNPGGNACFIDCSPSKCETRCRSRKPKCNGYGALCYDPRFVGGDGVMFYFHGIAKQSFCLVTDNNLHVNARFIGTRPEGRKRDFTWVEALAVMYGVGKKLSIAALKTGMWDEKVDRMAITYDGKEVHLPTGESSFWRSPNEDVRIERTSNVNSANIIVDGLIELDVNVVPITEQDNKIHRYMLNLTKDCFTHLDVQFKFLGLSNAVNGILGQTYQPDYKSPVKIGVPMPIMGGEDRFMASSLFHHDCKVNRFGSHMISTMATQPLGQKSFQCSSNNKEGGGFLCKR